MLIGLILIILFYFFIVLPNAVKKHVKGKIKYRDELQNLRECIDKADSVFALNMCWHAVIEFHLRNKYLKGLNVTKDAKKLYLIIRHKLKTINN